MVKKSCNPCGICVECEARKRICEEKTRSECLVISLVIIAFMGLLKSCIASAAPVECENHPIFCQILNNKPSIDKKYAMKLSNIIHNQAKIYKIDARIYTAILMQESKYELKAKNCTKGLIKAEVVIPESPIKYTENKVCTDFGVAQIHYKTANRYNFNLEELTSNLEYSVAAGAKVLSDFRKKYKHKETTYWTRYNSSSNIKREIYLHLVSRYF